MRRMQWNISPPPPRFARVANERIITFCICILHKMKKINSKKTQSRNWHSRKRKETGTKERGFTWIFEYFQLS